MRMGAAIPPVFNNVANVSTGNIKILLTPKNFLSLNLILVSKNDSDEQRIPYQRAAFRVKDLWPGKLCWIGRKYRVGSVVGGQVVTFVTKAHVPAWPNKGRRAQPVLLFSVAKQELATDTIKLTMGFDARSENK